MLVLGRRFAESVTLILPSDPEEIARLAGAKISVQVTATLDRNGRVRLGFDADRAIKIYRSELLEGGD